MLTTRTANFNGTSGREKRHSSRTAYLGQDGETRIGILSWRERGRCRHCGTRGYQRWDVHSCPRLHLAGRKDLSPRAYLEFDYASGDKKPGGNVGTFNQLFPNGHSYLGYIDYIGRQNIISSSAGISVTPLRDLTLSFSNISSGEPPFAILSTTSPRP